MTTATGLPMITGVAPPPVSGVMPIPASGATLAHLVLSQAAPVVNVRARIIVPIPPTFDGRLEVIKGVLKTVVEPSEKEIEETVASLATVKQKFEKVQRDLAATNQKVKIALDTCQDIARDFEFVMQKLHYSPTHHTDDPSEHVKTVQDVMAQIKAFEEKLQLASLSMSVLNGMSKPLNDRNLTLITGLKSVQSHIKAVNESLDFTSQFLVIRHKIHDEVIKANMIKFRWKSWVDERFRDRVVEKGMDQKVAAHDPMVVIAMSTFHGFLALEKISQELDDMSVMSHTYTSTPLEFLEAFNKEKSIVVGCKERLRNIFNDSQHTKDKGHQGDEAWLKGLALTIEPIVQEAKNIEKEGLKKFEVMQKYFLNIPGELEIVLNRICSKAEELQKRVKEVQLEALGIVHPKGGLKPKLDRRKTIDPVHIFNKAIQANVHKMEQVIADLCRLRKEYVAKVVVSSFSFITKQGLTIDDLKKLEEMHEHMMQLKKAEDEANQLHVDAREALGTLKHIYHQQEQDVKSREEKERASIPAAAALAGGVVNNAGAVAHSAASPVVSPVQSPIAVKAGKVGTGALAAAQQDKKAERPKTPPIDKASQDMNQLRAIAIKFWTRKEKLEEELTLFGNSYPELQKQELFLEINKQFAAIKEQIFEIVKYFNNLHIICRDVAKGRDAWVLRVEAESLAVVSADKEKLQYAAEAATKILDDLEARLHGKKEEAERLAQESLNKLKAEDRLAHEKLSKLKADYDKRSLPNFVMDIQLFEPFENILEKIVGLFPRIDIGKARDQCHPLRSHIDKFQTKIRTLSMIKKLTVADQHDFKAMSDLALSEREKAKTFRTVFIAAVKKGYSAFKVELRTLEEEGKTRADKAQSWVNKNQKQKFDVAYQKLAEKIRIAEKAKQLLLVNCKQLEDHDVPVDYVNIIVEEMIMDLDEIQCVRQSIKELKEISEAGS